MFPVLIAWLHFLLIFVMLFVLSFCWTQLKLFENMTTTRLRHIVIADTIYNFCLAILIVIGLTRVFGTEKGWHYYSHNYFFHLKMLGYLLLIGTSVFVSLKLRSWQTSARLQGILPTEKQMLIIRKTIAHEAHVFALLALFAALMSKGFGYFG